MTNCWKLEATDQTSHARAGYLTTRNGTKLPTPLFQPVAKAASLDSGNPEFRRSVAGLLGDLGPDAVEAIPQFDQACRR